MKSRRGRDILYLEDKRFMWAWLVNYQF
jgi:hypothetical protein